MSRHFAVFGIVMVGLVGACARDELPERTYAIATTPQLGSAQRFAVLGASTVTNTGPTQISGNLGVSPSAAITGFPPGLVTGGTVHAADAVALQAQVDENNAYVEAAGQPCDVDLTGKDLGGMTLLPGVYCFDSSAQLTGTLVLEFSQQDPNADFIFKMGSTLTTATDSALEVVNGSPCNITWQVGSSATLGVRTRFAGNILALASITLDTGAQLQGRALAHTGAVTLDANHVSIAACVDTAPADGGAGPVDMCH